MKKRDAQSVLTFKQAVKLDSSFYADKDEDVGFGVFGDISGFCYAEFGSMAAAQSAAKQRNAGMKALEEIFG